MNHDKRLAAGLLALRLTVFLVMFMWTLDKFVNPAHAAGVFAHFYGLAGFGEASLALVAVLEMALILAFGLGLWKRFSYAAVLLLHAVSTVSSYEQYLSPWQPGSLLFFAAWPMLAACFVLYLLRDQDVLLTLQRAARSGEA